MKKIAILLCLLFFMTSVDQIFAHSGRTDSSGGHNCSEKSQAKGLCDGYHYHNGGSTQNKQTEIPATTTKDKDCTDFSTYDEVVDYWNQKGYSASNDPENLDGWGNGVVDDGIPCEPPDGYDKTKINNSSEQLAFKQKREDQETGKEEGYNVGKQDGYSGNQENPDVSSGSESYRESYHTAYIKGYEEGKSKIEQEKSIASEAGYKSGQETETIKIPESYIKNQLLRNAYEAGFDKALLEKTVIKIKKLRNKGYEDGMQDIQDPPNNLEEQLLNAYKEGYEEAQKELQEKYYNEGYAAAFSSLQYSEPEISSKKFTKWYKEGFISNKEVQKIKEAGKKLGESGEDYTIAKEYKKGENIFEYYYQVGYEKYEKNRKEKQATTTTGIGFMVLSWLGRRLYIAKKMIS